jgi:hypothetical protein
MLFTKKKNDITEYVQRDVLGNFVTGSRNGEVGVVVIILNTNLSSLRSIDTIKDNDSTGLAVSLNKGRDLGSNIERMGVAGGSRMLEIGLPSSELVIQNAINIDESNTKLIKLQ